MSTNTVIYKDIHLSSFKFDNGLTLIGSIRPEVKALLPESWMTSEFLLSHLLWKPILSEFL